jgi:hypothetical protein
MMSALPTKQTLRLRKPMSAKCQKRTLPNLFNHLVGAAEQRYGECKTQQLRRFKIDHEFNPCVLFDRQFSRTCTPENFSAVNADETARFQ